MVLMTVEEFYAMLRQYEPLVAAGAAGGIPINNKANAPHAATADPQACQ